MLPTEVATPDLDRLLGHVHPAQMTRHRGPHSLEAVTFLPVLVSWFPLLRDGHANDLELVIGIQTGFMIGRSANP
jgi:hypothetical protein